MARSILRLRAVHPQIQRAALITGLLLLIGSAAQAAPDTRLAEAAQRRDMAVRRFDETFSDVDQVLVRIVERVDIAVHDLGDRSNAGALIGLFDG